MAQRAPWLLCSHGSTILLKSSTSARSSLTSTPPGTGLDPNCAPGFHGPFEGGALRRTLSDRKGEEAVRRLRCLTREELKRCGVSLTLPGGLLSSFDRGQVTAESVNRRGLVPVNASFGKSNRWRVFPRSVSKGITDRKFKLAECPRGEAEWIVPFKCGLLSSQRLPPCRSR